MEKLFSTFEVAKIFQVSPASVSRWIREGKLVSSVTVGGHHRVGAEAIRALLKTLRMPVPLELNPHGRQKVLIADPDAKTRKILRLYLTSFPELEIEEARDGFEAGWKAHALRPNLIILDFSILLSASGPEPALFLKKLTEASEASLFLTGNQREINGVRKRFSSKVKVFVMKPFDAELFKRQAGECLDGLGGGRRAKAG